MSLNLIKLIIISLITFSTYAQTQDGIEINKNSNDGYLFKEKNDRWLKLINLINQEIQTIKSNIYTSPELKHRLFELFTEKIKLIKEKENQNFLSAGNGLITKKGRDAFFKNSFEQYKTAQQYGILIIKENPDYKKNNEILYALAINSRDFGDGNDTEKYLKKSIATSLGQDKILKNAKTALAEFYYNNKKYSEAINYYQDIIKDKDSEWYGKHLYNASWCYLKERNFKKALELINISFETTKIKKYVSMKEQILNAISIFFVQADSTKEAIQFFNHNTTPSAPHLLILAQASMSKNNFSITNEILKSALEDTQKRNDYNLEMKVRIAQLDIYKESKKDELFFETSIKIHEINKKHQVNNEDLNAAINRIKEVAGFMQISLVKDKTKEEINYKKDDFNKIIKYFDILSNLDKTNTSQYRYYQGETCLSVHDYQNSVKFYTRSILNSKKNKKINENTKKSIEALLATLDLTKLPTKSQNEYTIFALKNYILFYPLSDKSQTIYQRLFNKYFELNDLKRAVNIFLVYKYYYPKDEAIHREMLTQILNSYIKSKNTNKIAFWVGKIEKGYLNFKNDYIESSLAVLGGLLFEKYQSLEKKGLLTEAQRGYESIYESKKYPIRIKAEAAYAVAGLLLGKNKGNESHAWLIRSLDLYSENDLLKILPSILSMTKEFRLLQRIDLSQNAANIIFKKFCFQDYETKEKYYELLISNSYLEDEALKSIIKNENENSKCNLKKSFIEEMELLSLGKIIILDNFEDAISYFKIHHKNEYFAIIMSKYLKFKFWQSDLTDKSKMIVTLKELNQLEPKLNVSQILDNYEKITELKDKIDSLKFLFTQFEKFDEDKYNSELEQFFAIIASVNKEAVQISLNGSPEAIIYIQQLLTLPYLSLSESIKNFTPRGVDSKYLDGFKLGMRQILESLSAKVLQIEREKKTFLEKNNFFFEVQKYAKFENVREIKKENLQKSFDTYSASYYTNSLDITKGLKK